MRAPPHPDPPPLPVAEPGGSAAPAAAADGGLTRETSVFAEEVRLLYENAPTGVAATVVIAAILALALWPTVPHRILDIWLLYVAVIGAARLLVTRRYWKALPGADEAGPWNRRFVAGAALAAAGWGLGAFALYSTATPMSEVLVIFTVGGVMLGGASLLAARPEAFLTFLLPTGGLTAVRVAVEGDDGHVLMALLCAVFTAATALTTWRFHKAIESSLLLRFDNHDLIHSLRAAKADADALNRELEARVRERTAKLEEEDRRKDEFLATLAHELRNPLAPIRFALERLKDDAPAPPAAHAREVIERQVAQLVRLVDDLLDVSRISANKIRLRREPVDLGHLMTTAVESIAPLAAAASQTLEVTLPSSPVRVDGDGARLVQVFANVLNNATKFTPPGGHIWFSCDRESDEAVVRIRDNGTGIAPDLLPRIFEMFRQAEPALERSTGGLGIGLTLAQRLVEMHAGTIAVTSPGIGQGTEVEIRLPTTSDPAVSVAPAAQPSTSAGRQLRVLIVEDNLDAAEMLQFAVSSLGHITKLAHDGAAALAAASEFGPDVIFLDIGLPVVNGYTVARALREKAEFDHVHIAAVTGWGQEEDRRQAREAGCDSHFTKPLSPATLESVLTVIAQSASQDPAGGRPPRTRLADSAET